MLAQPEKVKRRVSRSRVRKIRCFIVGYPMFVGSADVKKKMMPSKAGHGIAQKRGEKLKKEKMRCQMSDKCCM